MSDPTLFPECVLPGCTTLVDAVGVPCDDCLKSDVLRHNPGGRRMTEAEIAARDATTDRMYEALALIKDPALRDRFHIVDHRVEQCDLPAALLVGAETRGRDEFDGRRIESIRSKAVYL
ncbi:MAG: hypothetical protein INR72_15530 [Williamsia herbipolensis]|nr:hypothetical protein [Williamsia herbipolensis]